MTQIKAPGCVSQMAPYSLYSAVHLTRGQWTLTGYCFLVECYCFLVECYCFLVECFCFRVEISIFRLYNHTVFFVRVVYFHTSFFYAALKSALRYNNDLLNWTENNSPSIPAPSWPGEQHHVLRWPGMPEASNGSHEVPSAARASPHVPEPQDQTQEVHCRSTLRCGRHGRYQGVDLLCIPFSLYIVH